jgi:hypothetical protein
VIHVEGETRERAWAVSPTAANACAKVIEQAFEVKSLRLPWLAVDPALDPLRTEPKYHALLARMGRR